MRQYIKQLQSKEEHVRKQILVVALVLSMSVASLVWVYSLNSRFNNNSLTVAKDTNYSSPFKLFGNMISDTYHNISASVGNISSLKNPAQQSEKQIPLIPVEHDNQ